MNIHFEKMNGTPMDSELKKKLARIADRLREIQKSRRPASPNRKAELNAGQDFAPDRDAAAEPLERVE